MHLRYRQTLGGKVAGFPESPSKRCQLTKCSLPLSVFGDPNTIVLVMLTVTETRPGLGGLRLSLLGKSYSGVTEFPWSHGIRPVMCPTPIWSTHGGS